MAKNAKKPVVPHLAPASLKDYSRENPALHKLHVDWAYQTMVDLNAAIETFAERSQVDCSILAGLLHEQRAKFLIENQAYRDAAILILCGMTPKGEPHDHGISETAS